MPQDTIPPAAGAVQRWGYLPFGAGATKCIGEEFGLAEATLILASVVNRWDVSLVPGTRITPAARAVLIPCTYPVQLSAR